MLLFGIIWLFLSGIKNGILTQKRRYLIEKNILSQENCGSIYGEMGGYGYMMGAIFAVDMRFESGFVRHSIMSGILGI